MKVFVSSAEKVEINGENVYAIIDGMGIFKSKAIKILAENGIVDPKPGQWYSQQAWLNAFKTITEQIGALTLYAVGQKITENAKLPHHIDNIHQALASIDIAYQTNHRNGFTGNYFYEKTGEKSARITCSNPYPDIFDKGIITAMANKFNNGELNNLKIYIDESMPVRMKGGESTTFIISW